MSTWQFEDVAALAAEANGRLPLPLCDWTPEERATVARFDAAPTPPEVREARVVEEVAQALAEAQGVGRTATPLTRRLAAAAVAAYRAAQDGGAEEAVRRVEELAERYDVTAERRRGLPPVRMTAPAEDPRGGEYEVVIDDQCPITFRRCDRPCGTECIRGMFAAAGRGDTDIGGEAEYAGHVGSCRIFYAERRCTCVGSAPRPAGDRAQPTEELREAIGRALEARSTVIDGLATRVLTADLGTVTDELLALPAVAALLDAQAKVKRVEAAIPMLADVAKSIEYDVCDSEPSQFKANELGKAMGYRRSARDPRRALDGA